MLIVTHVSNSVLKSTYHLEHSYEMLTGKRENLIFKIEKRYTNTITVQLFLVGNEIVELSFLHQ